MLSCVRRLTAEKKVRQDFEDKHEQLVAKLNFDTRQHEQVYIHKTASSRKQIALQRV